MTKNKSQKKIKQREKTIKNMQLRILNELDKERVQEDFLLALKKCSSKVVRLEEVFQ